MDRPPPQSQAQRERLGRGGTRRLKENGGLEASEITQPNLGKLLAVANSFFERH